MAIQRKENINKMIYARSTSVLADDDDHLRSICFPAEAIVGFLGIASLSIAVIYFRGLYDYAPTDVQNTSALIVALPSGQQKTLANDLIDELVNGEKSMIVLGDNVTEEYFSVITNVSSISTPTTDD